MRRPEIPSLKCQAVPFLLLFLPITPSPLPKLVAEGWVVDGHWCPSRPQQLPKLQPSSLCYQDCSEKPIIRQPWSDSALIQHWAPQGVGKSAFSWFSESVTAKQEVEVAGALLVASLLKIVQTNSSEFSSGGFIWPCSSQTTYLKWQQARDSRMPLEAHLNYSTTTWKEP